MAETNRWRLKATVGGLSAVLALATGAPPATAAEPVHSVMVSKDESIVVASGLTEGDPVQVEVRRNGIQIGSAVGVTPPGGVFELNHQVEAVADTAVCWTGFTPHILGGDVVRVTSGGAEDEVVVTDIHVTQGPTRVDADTATVLGRVAGPVPPVSELEVTTQGRTASDERFDGLAPGTSDGVAGKLRYVAPGRFKATFNGFSPAQMGAFLDSSDVKATHVSAESLSASHSTVATYAADARFTEDLCPAVARRAVTRTSEVALNRDNVDGSLRVWGVSADATEVLVRIEDRNGAERLRPATLTGSGAAQTWSATFPAGSLVGLADGMLALNADHTVGGGVLAGAGHAIRKDTVAPAGPRIRPRGGTFLRRETIRLRAPGAREIWYTLGGARPGRHRGAEYSGAFTLARSATLRAIAFDAAGNASPVSSARFTRR